MPMLGTHYDLIQSPRSERSDKDCKFTEYIEKVEDLTDKELEHVHVVRPQGAQEIVDDEGPTVGLVISENIYTKSFSKHNSI